MVIGGCVETLAAMVYTTKEPGRLMIGLKNFNGIHGEVRLRLKLAK